MAATGKTPILLYGSTTSSNAPVAANLTNSSDGCEIAINVADKNLFFKDSTNTVNTVPIRQSSTSSNGWLSSTDWNTFNNKVSSQWVTSGSAIYYSGNIGVNTTPSDISNIYSSQGGADYTLGTNYSYLITGNGYSAAFALNATSFQIGQNSSSRAITFHSGSGWTERFRINSSGTVVLASTTGLSIGRTAVTAPASTDGNVFSGTYTPSQVSTNTNITTITFSSCRYMRVGDVVTVSGQVAITATATASTVAKFSVPIASAFTVSGQLAGTGATYTTPYGTSASMAADATNDCIEMRFVAPNTNALAWQFSFTYIVV